MKEIILLLSLSLFLAASLYAADEEPGRPEYTIKRCTGKITIDGVLDEPDWAAATPIGEFKFPWYNYEKREETQKAELEKTEVKMLWDDDFLYVYYKCEDKHIWADHYNSNSQTYKDDCVEFFWNPNPAAGNAYNMFEMNCIGNLLSVFNMQDNKLLAHKILPPHMAQTIQGTVNNDADADTSWVLEVALRFSDYPDLFDAKTPKDGDMWRVGLNRCGGKTNNQSSQWSPSKIASFHSPEDFGKIFFNMKPVK